MKLFSRTYQLSLAALFIACLPATANAVHSDPAPMDPAMVKQIMARQPSAVSPAAQALERHLAELQDITRPAEERVGRRLSETEAQSAATSQRSMAAAKRGELVQLRQQIRAEFQQTRQRLLRLGNSGQVAAWDALLVQVESRFQALDKELEASNVEHPGNREQAFRRLADHLKDIKGNRDARDMGVGDLPSPTMRSGPPPEAKPAQPSEKTPAYLANRAPGNNVYAFLGTTLLAAVPTTPAEAASCAYTAADLAATADAPQTADIQALAAQLGYSPVKIFQYVSNNIAFQPYYGGLKGAVTTLESKAGGPTDQASLLVALLRASNIPARYVRGTITVNDAVADSKGGRLGRWIGAKSYFAAATMLSQGLFRPTSYSSVGATFQHVWVEACVPYGRYRGASLDTSGERWIPLDPSFKDKTYQAGIATSVAFDYTSYLAKRTNGPDSLPHEAFAQQLEANIRSSNPNATLGDVPYQGSIQKLNVDILPASLPYEVVYTNWPGTTSPEAASLPTAHRYRLAIGGLGLASAYNLYLPDVIRSRITLAFKGKTATDQAALDAWRLDGNTASVIPGTLNVVPVLRVEGVDQGIVGGSVLLSSNTNPLSLAVYLDEFSTNPVNAVNYANIGAANIHALQAYAFQGSNALITQRAANLVIKVNSTANANATADTLDATEGEFLHLVGLKWMRYISNAAKNIGGLNGTSGESGNHLGLTSSQVKVQYLFDLPYAVSRSGFLVDMPGVLSRDVDLTAGTSSWASFKLGGYASSAYESYIWQENAHLDAVSTVRGLQFANETGIGTVTLNSANWATVRPQLSVFAGATAEDCSYDPNKLLYPRCAIDSPTKGLLAQINLGYTITLPKSLINYDGWKGIIYVNERNVANASDSRCSGAYCAGYIISKYSGGYTLSNPISLVTLPGSISTTDPTLNQGFVAQSTVPVSIVTSAAATGNIQTGGLTTTTGITPATTVSGDPVNMVTGNMYHNERDINLKGRGGLPIVFERAYNSSTPVDGPLGFGWTHSFNQTLKLYGVENGLAKLSWIDGSGAERYFATSGQTAGNITLGSTIPNPAGVYVSFQRTADGSFTITEKNGLVYRFESKAGPSGVPGSATPPVFARLMSITDRNGNALNLSYGSTCGNNLCAVSDSLSHSLTFTYTGNHISQIQDFSGRTWQYGYDSNGNLTSFKNPLAVAGSQSGVSYSYYTTADGSTLNHRLKQYTLPRGNGMRFEYYANGRTLRHTVVNVDGSLAADQVNSFTYNDFRRETVQVSERGREKHFFFDQNGSPLKIVDENGAEHSYEYSQAGQPFNRTATIDPFGWRTTYVYDAAGNVTQSTAPSGAKLSYFDFNVFNQPRRIQDARGNWTILRYDTKGNLTDSIRTVSSYTPPACSTTECIVPAANQILAWTVNSFDTVGNLVSSKRVKDFTAVTGPILSYSFDANKWNAIQVSRSGVQNLDTSTSSQSASLSYDSLGRLTAGIDGDWQPTRFSYDALDRVVQATDRLGNLRSYQYDANGNPVGQQLVVPVAGVQALADSSATRYDDSDRKIASLDAAGFMTAYSYDGAGNLLSATNPDGYVIGFDYDDANRPVRAYDPLGRSVATSRDVDGKVRSLTDPSGNSTNYVYWDASRDGRLKSVASPTIQSFSAGRTLQYDYDSAGNSTSQTEIPAGGSGLSNRVSTSQYDELNRPVRLVGPQISDSNLGAICPVTRLAYDNLGRTNQVQAGYTPAPCTSAAADVVKTQVTTAYDDFDRVIKTTDALGRVSLMQYDGNNNPVAVQDPKGQVLTYTWGLGHQLLARVETLTGRSTRYTRNALGQVLTLAHPEASLSYSYDAAHRLVSQSETRPGMSAPKTSSYAWSPGGLLNSVTDFDGRVTRYDYDPAARLTGLTAPNGDTMAFRFDAAGRLAEKLLPNGVSSRYAYNADGSLKQLVNRNSANSILSQHDYAYDGVGNRASQTELIGGSSISYAYSYDELKRLTQVSNGTAAQQENYSYDPFGNRLRRSVGATTPVVTAYNYDAANQLTEIRSGSSTGALIASLSYDANGNLVSDGSRSYTWDPLNQLAKVTSGTTTVSYGYDGTGQRTRKTVTAGTASSTAQWLYNGDAIYAEYGSSWTLPTALTTAIGTDTPLIRTSLTGTGSFGTAQYYAQDGLGSVVATSNNSDASTANQRFDAWGNKLTSAGSIAQYGYTGREPDETGLIYYRARYYHPALGRFVSRDPAGIAGGMNLYAYVGNNPVNATDPTGLYAASTSAGFGGGVGGGGTAKGASTDNSTTTLFDPNISATSGNQTLSGFSGQRGQEPIQLAVCVPCSTGIAGAEAGSVFGPFGTAIGGVVGIGAGLWLGDKLWNSVVHNESASNGGNSNVPPIPDVIVGDQSDPRAGQNKGSGKHTSGPLAPEHGGTGDFQSDLDKLTGGVRPWQPGDKAPPGSLVGGNRIFGRPKNSSGGSSIDIPANGSKPHETLHYP